MLARVALLLFLTAPLVPAQYLNVSIWAYPTADLGGYRELKVGLRWDGIPAGGNSLLGSATGITFVWIDFNMGYQPMAMFPEQAAEPLLIQPDKHIFSPSSAPLELVVPSAPGVTPLAVVNMGGYDGLNWYFQPVQPVAMGQVARAFYPPGVYGTPAQIHVISWQDGELSGVRWWYRQATVVL